MTTIHITNNPKRDAYGIPVFPPIDTIWDTTLQVESWREILKMEHVAVWSECLINHLGLMVRKGEVDPLLLELKITHQDGKTQVARYALDGYLKNWPYGWFLPRHEYELIKSAK